MEVGGKIFLKGSTNAQALQPVLRAMSIAELGALTSMIADEINYRFDKDFQSPFPRPPEVEND